MTAQAALKDALRLVLAPVAKEMGFKGSAPTWRRSTASGDWAIVNVQSSVFSSADNLRCVVNLAVAPEPWLRWEAERLGTRMPKAVSESLGLYRERLHPAGTPAGIDGWWEISDSRSATEAARDMVVQLARDGWPVLERLITRDGMLDQLRQGRLGRIQRSNFGIHFARAEALLLMDDGPSADLDELLTYALNGLPAGQAESALQFDKWVRAQVSTTRRS